MKFALVQGSMNPHSNTALLCGEIRNTLRERNIDHRYFDLREHDFPMAGDFGEYGQNIANIRTQFGECSHFLFAFPIYNYSVSGPFMNFLNLIGDKHVFDMKPFGIIGVSSGIRSWLSEYDLAKPLVLHEGAIAVGPIVHAWAEDFQDVGIGNPKVLEKANELIDRLSRLDIRQGA